MSIPAVSQIFFAGGRGPHMPPLFQMLQRGQWLQVSFAGYPKAAGRLPGNGWKPPGEPPMGYSFVWTGEPLACQRAASLASLSTRMLSAWVACPLTHFQEMR